MPISLMEYYKYSQMSLTKKVRCIKHNAPYRSTQKMISIKTDLNSLNIQRNLYSITNRVYDATKHLTTGYKITQAADDAAGIFVATGLNVRVRAMEIGVAAVQTGISIINIAEGSINNMKNALWRIRDLAVQGANTFYDEKCRQAMQQEADLLIDEIYREKEGCQFNGKKLLDTGPPPDAGGEVTTLAASPPKTKDDSLRDDFKEEETATLNAVKNASNGNGAIRIHVGYDGTKDAALYIHTGFNLDRFSVDFSTAESSADSIEKIDEVINLLDVKLGTLGADFNRLQSVEQLNLIAMANFTASESIIKDADLAKESSELVKSQILQNATTTLLVQSKNIRAEIIKSILQI